MGKTNRKQGEDRRFPSVGEAWRHVCGSVRVMCVCVCVCTCMYVQCEQEIAQEIAEAATSREFSVLSLFF